MSSPWTESRVPFAHPGGPVAPSCDYRLVDTQWALEQCREWLRLHEKIDLPIDPTVPKGPKTKLRGTKEERERITNIVRLVSQAVGGHRNSQYADGVRALIFEIDEGWDVRERLGLVSTGPALESDLLHS